MKVFISWSGELSRELAGVLRMYFPCMIQGMDTFMSEHDIESGTRWGMHLAKELDTSNFGIICLTPDNLNNPWILFEAGALTKYADGRACGLLFGGLSPTDVSGPLSQFQNRVFNKSELKALLIDINQKLPSSLDTQQLGMVFEKWWPDIDRDCKEVLARSYPSPRSIKHRDSNDVLIEILTKVRGIERTIDKLPLLSKQKAHIKRTKHLENQASQKDYIVVEVDETFPKSQGEYRFRYTPDQSLYRLLNNIYFKLAVEVEAYTFGSAWTLQDCDTGESLSILESDWSRGITNEHDNRTLEEVGIRPGMKLRPILL